jgi:hypothetical protein
MRTTQKHRPFHLNIRSSRKNEPGGSGHKEFYFKLADALAKLTAAGAVVGAAIVANTYQSKMSTINLLSQRELAESQLRGTMFGDLISPMVGSSKGLPIDLEREQLLVELLTLNFHEHFESKPLLLHVEKRIRSELSGKDRERALSSLVSIVRRVSDRQIATLMWEARDTQKAQIERLSFTLLEPSPNPDLVIGKAEFAALKGALPESLQGSVGTPVLFPRVCVSPDQRWKLEIILEAMDFDKSTVRVKIDLKLNTTDQTGENAASPSNSSIPQERTKPIDFQLTYYDLPLTDNTLLGDGNRFAVILQNINKPSEIPLNPEQIRSFNDQWMLPPDQSIQRIKIADAQLSLIWFPKEYFTPRERPINYAEFSKSLGLRKE